MTDEDGAPAAPWSILFHSDAATELKKLGRNTAARILHTLETRIATLPDPRTAGAPLKGEHDGYWRWRVGNYRIVAVIQDERVTIVVVKVGHRREADR